MQAVGSNRTPFPVEEFRKVIASHMDLGEKDPGFTRYGELFREEQARRLVVVNGNAVDPQRVFKRTLPCGLAHPGYCASLHGGVLRHAKACSKSLHAAMRDAARGSFHHLRFVCENGEHHAAWFCLAHRRGGKPKLMLVVPVVFLRSDRLLELDDGGESSYDYKMDITFLGQLFQVLGPDKVLQVFWSPAPVASGSSRVTLREDWKQVVAASEVAVFPERPKVRVVKTTEEQDRLRKSLHKLVETTAGAKSKRRAQPAGGRNVQLRAPACGSDIGRVSDTCSSSDAGSDSSDDRSPVGHHSSSDEELPSFAVSANLGAGAAADGVAEDAPRHALVEARAHSAQDDGRGSRAIRFGPWSISSIVKGGAVVGWGGNCNKHVNECDRAGTKCKRAFLFIGLTSDATRCVAKQWLLLGAHIAHSDVQGRKRHLNDIRRSDIPIRDEASLDAEAAAYV